MTTSITPAQLAAVAPSCDAEELAPAFSAAADRWGISTPLRLAHFLTQGHVESGGFVRLEESLSYSAARMCQVWPKRFPTLADAAGYVNRPEKLAEKVYGGRRDLGNIEPGDGWRYRGRGFGLTGRANYRRYGQLIGVDLEAHPELASHPDVIASLGGAFWKTHNLNIPADADDVAAVTEVWNGGLTGLPDRRAALARYKTVLGIRAA